MNSYLIIILFILVFGQVVSIISELLDRKRMALGLPDEFKGVFDSQKYSESQKYNKARSMFRIIENGIAFLLLIVFIFAGGFNYIDSIARSYGFGEIITGLIFTGILFVLSFIISLPFRIYSNFGLEEKFGFNKYNIKTFVMDILKEILLSIILLTILLSIVFWFFIETGDMAWLYAWLALSLFSIFMQYLYPSLVLPMLYKMSPLPDGELKEGILRLAGEVKVSLSEIYTIDSSKRTAKTNAFFVGIGKGKRFVLFDNVLKKHTYKELLSIFAHELGHFQLNHISHGLLLQIMSSGLMFYILSFFIGNRDLFDAFGMEYVSVYAGLVFFLFLYSPISLVISLFVNYFSRVNEYEADKYAIITTNDPGSMIDALKKMSVDNMANLQPHRLKVWLSYTHPPMLQRIKGIRKLEL